jgi:hypothetical protein
MPHKLVKSFDKNTDELNIESSGVFSNRSWESFMPLLRHHFDIKPNEKIVGIVVTDLGIKAKIETVKH